MLAVHVRIGHEHDLVVASLFDIEIITDAGAEGGNHRLNFGVRQGAVQASALNVQDLTAQRQNSLGVRVTALNRRTTCGVTLHQVNLRDRRILRGFGADGKAFRHRHAQLGHFGHAGTLALPRTCIHTVRR